MARKRTMPVGACRVCGAPLFDARAKYCGSTHRVKAWRADRDAEVTALLLAAKQALAAHAQ